MKAQELFLSDGRPSGVWHCGKCGHVSPSLESADGCCKPYHCDTCGIETPRYHLRCMACRAKAIEKAEQERYAEAKPVLHRDVDGPIYIEQYDTYDPDPEEFAALKDVDVNTLRLYACKPYRAHTVALSVIENALEDAYEDADCDIPYEAVKELQALLDGWWERNEIVSWHPDWSRKVVLEEEKP